MRLALFLTALALAPTAHGDMAAAQHAHSADHAAHSVAPSEPGQDAFAAIAEIVALLEADAETDWSKVDIDALRSHLQDMNLVTLHAEASRSDLPDGARFRITGDAETAAAIQRMTIAHAPFLEQAGAWRVDAEPAEGGAVLTVRSEDPAVVARIRGLGYFGLMTQGAHHQPHHLAIASGDPHPHAE